MGGLPFDPPPRLRGRVGVRGDILRTVPRSPLPPPFVRFAAQALNERGGNTASEPQPRP